MRVGPVLSSEVYKTHHHDSREQRKRDTEADDESGLLVYAVVRHNDQRGAELTARSFRSCKMIRLRLPCLELSPLQKSPLSIKNEECDLTFVGVGTGADGDLTDGRCEEREATCL